MCCDSVTLDLSDAHNILLEGDNGNGKSALLDAIALCFAEHRRADKFADYVQNGYNEGVIDLTATINDEKINFHIVLLVEGGTPFNRTVTYKGQTYQNTEVTGLLEKLELPFYSRIIFSMQGSDDIATMSPSVRADYLQRLLQFNFEYPLQKIRNKLTELETNKLYNKSQIEFNEKAIQAKKLKELRELPISENVYENYKTEISKLKDEVSKKNSLYSGIIEKTNKVNELKSFISDFDNKINLNARATDLLRSIEEKIASDKEQLKEIPTIEKSENYDSEIEENEKKIELLNMKIRDSIEEKSELNATLSKLKEREELHKKGLCPVCGQKTDFIAEENNVAEIRKISGQILGITSDIEKAEKEIQELKSLIDEIDTKKTAEAQLIVDNNSKRTVLEAEIAGYSRQKSGITFYELSESDYNDSVKEKDLLEEEIFKTQKEVDAFKEKEARIEFLQKEIDEFSDTLLQNSWIEKDNEKIRAEIDNYKSQIEKLKENVITQEKTYEYHKEAKKLLELDLPNYLIVKTCAKLEQEMNDFIHIVFPNMYVALFQKKRGVEFFYSKNGPILERKNCITAKMASGFERSLLSIAFKVALCKAYNLSLSVLDEVDAFASDSNSEKVYTSLIESGIFNQLFIITHKPSTRETIKDMFDNITYFYVEKGKFTEIEG